MDPTESPHRRVLPTSLVRSQYAARVPSGVTRTSTLLVAAALVACGLGCESGLRSIDRSTTAKLRESAEAMGGGAIYPEIDPSRYESGSYFPDFPKDVDRPATVNPAANELTFEAIPATEEDAESIAARFRKMAEGDPNARLFSFDDSVGYAIQHADEYLTAEEAYLIIAIRLLIEEHRWTPLPANVTSLSRVALDSHGVPHAAIAASTAWAAVSPAPGSPRGTDPG